MKLLRLIRKYVKRQPSNIRPPDTIWNKMVYCGAKFNEQWISPFASCNLTCDPDTIRNCKFLHRSLGSYTSQATEIIIRTRDLIPVAKPLTRADIEARNFVETLEVKCSLTDEKYFRIVDRLE